MKNFFALASAVLGLAGLAQAHMEMTEPAPFKSKANPNAGSDVDYSMTAPLEAGGGNFPCKGYHSLFGTDAGKPTAEYKAGGTYQMTITGGANHGGGSCQASLSFDKGASWVVIHSYIGNCPAAGTSKLDFTIPADTPSGDVIFAWTWFNKIGNREMYMNCAAVTITGGSKKRDDNDKRATALSSRPAMFIANVNNGCTTKEGSDLKFPNPGPSESDDSSNTAPPVGSCASSGGGSGGGGSGDVGSNPGNGSGDGNSGSPSSPAGGAPSSPASTQAPVAPSQPAVTPSAPANSPIGGSPTSVPGGVFITVSQPADGTEAPVAPTSVVEAPVAPSSTLLTITRSAGGGGSGEAPAVPTSPSTPNAPSAAPTPVPTPGEGSGTNPGNGGGSGSANTPGTSCQNEGEWNCVGGTQFQRCASGQWSVLLNVAPGTTCSGFNSRVKRGSVRYAAPWRI